MLHHFRDIIDYFPKFKEVTWPSSRPLEGLFVNLKANTCTSQVHMANHCTKFEVLSPYRDILGGTKNLIWGHMAWPRPFQGQFVIHRLDLADINLQTKFEVSKFTLYEDMEGNAKCKNWGSLAWLGVTQDHRRIYLPLGHLGHAPLWSAKIPHRHGQKCNLREVPQFFEILCANVQQNHWNCCYQMSDLKAKMHQIRFWLGLRPHADPAGGAYIAAPDLLAGFKGAYF